MRRNIGQLKHGDVTDAVLFAFYKRVYLGLGGGFLEKVYENAITHELRKTGLSVRQQPKVDVYYDGIVVGEYYPDLIVEDKVVLELKAVSQINALHEAQLINYLRATPYEVGLLLNFGPKPTHKRRVFENNRKKRT